MKMNTPNRLTLLRMILVPVFVAIYLIEAIPYPLRDWLALAVFTLAAVTDFIDGKLARSQHLVTDFGKFMDPLADKLLVCSALICMIQTGLIPAWIVCILIGREFVISGFRLVAANKGIVIAAGIWGKAKTMVQMIAVVLLLIPYGAEWFYIICMILVYASAVLSIISVVEYIARNIDVLKEGEN